MVCFWTDLTNVVQVCPIPEVNNLLLSADGWTLTSAAFNDVWTLQVNGFYGESPNGMLRHDTVGTGKFLAGEFQYTDITGSEWPDVWVQILDGTGTVLFAARLFEGYVDPPYHTKTVPFSVNLDGVESVRIGTASSADPFDFGSMYGYDGKASLTIVPTL